MLKRVAYIIDELLASDNVCALFSRGFSLSTLSKDDDDFLLFWTAGIVLEEASASQSIDVDTRRQLGYQRQLESCIRIAW